MAGPIWNALPGSGERAVADRSRRRLGGGAELGAPRRHARAALEAATRAGRLVALAPTSQGGLEIAALDAPRGADRLRALAPVPYPPQRAGDAAADRPFPRRQPADAKSLWIADGVELGGAAAFARALSRRRARPQAVGRARQDDGDRHRRRRQSRRRAAGASARAAPTAAARGRRARARRAGPVDRRGAVRLRLGPRDRREFDLPVELRNEIARLVVADEASAGATWLVDERSRRRRVAIVSGASADVAQPLLSPAYYITRALAPYAEVREARGGRGDTIDALLAEKPSVMALADMSVPPGPAHDKLAAFVESGGVLLRFAGTRLAAGDDDLTPTALRRGGRTLGGALSWETPKHIAAFDKESPFFGLAAPDEVTVSRQVLAEPEPGLAGKTWARLADGTPLVTAAPRGKGLIVLFHVTADTTWSNLPLSGLFVDMLRRVVARAGPAPAESSAAEKASARRRARPIAPSTASARLGPAGRSRADRRRFRRPLATRAIRPASTARADALEAVNALAPGAALAPADYGGRDDRRRRSRRRRAARSQAVAAARRPHRLPRRRPRQPVARPPAALR